MAVLFQVCTLITHKLLHTQTKSGKVEESYNQNLTKKNLCGRSKTLLGNKRSWKFLWEMGLEHVFRAGGRVSLSLNQIKRPA